MIDNISHFAVLSVHVAVTSCAVIQVNKHELVAHLGIPFRDLRILDPSVRPHHVRPHFCQSQRTAYDFSYVCFDLSPSFLALNELSDAAQTLTECLL